MPVAARVPPQNPSQVLSGADFVKEILDHFLGEIWVTEHAEEKRMKGGRMPVINRLQLLSSIHPF